MATLVTVIALAAAACGTTSATGETNGSGTGSPGGTSTGGSASTGPGGVVSSLPTPRTAPLPVVPVKTSCTGWPSNAPAGKLTASFTPAAVLHCVTGYTEVPGKGRWLTATLERATAGLAPLASALRAPSFTRHPGQMCPAFMMQAPQIVLVAADGKTLRPEFPVTGCGQIQPQVFRALAALHWATVSQRLIQRVSTPANP